MEALESEETVGDHDKRQMTMQSIPASSLEAIEATFLLGIFVQLLNHPASRTRRCNEASSGSTLKQYVIFSSSFSCGSTGVDCGS